MMRRFLKLTTCSAVLLLFTALWLFVWRRPLSYDGWAIAPVTTLWAWREWIVPFIVLGFFGGLAALAAFDRFRRAKNRKEQTQSTILSLLMLMAFATVWPWALLGSQEEPNQVNQGGLTLVEAFFSDLSNEYFGTAYRIDDVRQFSREYAQKWQKPASFIQSHVATHPPGAVLFFYGARRVLESSPRLESALEAFAEWLVRAKLSSIAEASNQVREVAARSAGAPEPAPLPISAVTAALWSAFLCSLALGLTVPAIYWIASGHPLQNTPNEARGLFAAALFAFAPTVGLFAFTLDALIACGAAWTLALIAKAIVVRHESGSRLWLIGAGIVLGFTTFLSIGALATGAIVVFAMAFSARREAYPLRDFATGVCFFGFGFVAAGILLMLIFPMQPFAIFHNAMAAHRSATLVHRTGAAWPLMNLVFFLPFCGWPVVTACLTAWRGESGGVIQEAKNMSIRPVSSLQSSFLIGGATLAAIVAQTLSGGVRGEVERLWLFLVPPLCALASASIAPAKTSRWRPLLALQIAQSVLMAAGLAPLVRPIG